MKSFTFVLLVAVCSVALPTPPFSTFKPTPLSTTLPSTSTRAAPSVDPASLETDLCAQVVKDKCSKAILSKNMLSVMECSKKLFNDIINQTAVSSVTDAGCVLQMKGSIALLCVKDFQRQCDETATFKQLKTCAHKNMKDFSIGCQVAVQNFQEKLEIAQKRLWKQSKKHFEDASESSEEEDQQIEDDTQEEYQFLWGGEILSDPDPSKWRRIWHTYGKWVAGTLGLILMCIVARCYRKRKRARRALRMAQQNGEAPVEGNDRRPCRWSRWRGCSRNFWQNSSTPLRGNDMSSSSVSFVEVPVARVVQSNPTPTAPSPYVTCEPVYIERGQGVYPSTEAV